MDKQNICAIQQNQWKDKIINEKLKRNDKNIKSDLKQTDKKKIKNKKKRSIRRNMRRLKKYLEDQHKSAPHPLIVIKKKIFQHVKNHSVILTNMRRKDINKKNVTDGGITCYSIKYIGDNVADLFHAMEIHPYSNLHDINNSNLLGDYLLILCEANEKCLVDDPNITFIPNEVEDDDYVLLMMYVHNTCTSNLLQQLPIWDNVMDLAEIKKSKKSTINSSNYNHHYGSTGECYSFGVRNAFSTSQCTNITITNYAGDDSSTMQKYKKYIWDNFDIVFKSFDQKIPGLSKYLNITCKSMEHQCKGTELSSYMNNHYNKGNMAHSQSMLSGNINVNAMTRDIHCEKDITYTTIHVPHQQENDAYIVFEFQLNPLFSLKIQVLQNCSFTYSAYCLAHRQVYTYGFNCINLSTYSTKRLYNHYRLSLNRLKKN